MGIAGKVQANERDKLKLANGGRKLPCTNRELCQQGITGMLPSYKLLSRDQFRSENAILIRKY
jgi:hypothetical protein